MRVLFRDGRTDCRYLAPEVHGKKARLDWIENPLR